MTGMTSPEWNAKWRWPVETRVSVPTRTGRVFAIVTKENTTTVNLRTDSGEIFRRVPMRLLTREVGQ